MAYTATTRVQFLKDIEEAIKNRDNGGVLKLKVGDPISAEHTIATFTDEDYTAPDATRGAARRDTDQKFLNAACVYLDNLLKVDGLTTTLDSAIEDLNKIVDNDYASNDKFQSALSDMNKKTSGSILDNLNLLNTYAEAIEKNGNTIGRDSTLLKSTYKSMIKNYENRIKDLKQRAILRYNSKVRLLKEMLAKANADDIKNAFNTIYAPTTYSRDAYNNLLNEFKEIPYGTLQSVNCKIDVLKDFNPAKMDDFVKFVREASKKEHLLETEADGITATADAKTETFESYVNAKLDEIEDKVSHCNENDVDALNNALAKLEADFKTNIALIASGDKKKEIQDRIDKLKNSGFLFAKDDIMSMIVSLERECAYFETEIYPLTSDSTVVNQMIDENLKRFSAVEDKISALTDANLKKKYTDRIQKIKDRYDFLRDYSKERVENLEGIDTNISLVGRLAPQIDKTNKGWIEKFKNARKMLDESFAAIRLKRRQIKASKELTEDQKTVLITKLDEKETQLNNLNSQITRKVPFYVKGMRKASTFFNKHKRAVLIGLGLAGMAGLVASGLLLGGTGIVSLATKETFGPLLANGLAKLGISLPGLAVNPTLFVGRAATNIVKWLAIGSPIAGIGLSTLIVKKLSNLVKKNSRKKNKGAKERRRIIEDIDTSIKSGGVFADKDKRKEKLVNVAKKCIQVGYDITNDDDKKKIQNEYKLSDEDMHILISCMYVEQGKRSR